MKSTLTVIPYPCLRVNEYEVMWERKSNCERGINYTNDKDGTIGNSVVFIC